jgi:hypothetical protein
MRYCLKAGPIAAGNCPFVRKGKVQVIWRCFTKVSQKNEDTGKGVVYAAAK